ncbi:MAG: bifunctional diaminohydroxyphosphoribosylaminopyrimidine deaminase/5-amino-6-(5-phosphoribosylamino)uracil reductase RibD [Verrucomicrobiota bacterium]
MPQTSPRTQRDTEAADIRFMKLALAEARKGLGATSPNPPVGAIVVKGTRILAKGHHRQAGAPHAEPAALAQCSARQLNGATLYVTLEPCSTQGKTPPCTQTIVNAKIARVVFGATDPNPQHKGRATRLLRAKNIDVTPGVLEKECQHLIRFFAKSITDQRPFVIAKSAMTLDGRITPAQQSHPWITGPTARQDVQALRAEVDAILIGGSTLRADNPRLTLRGEFAKQPRPQPWRIVQTRSGKLPKTSRLFTDRHQDRTLVFKNKSLRQILQNLHSRGVTSVLLESGGNIMGQAFKYQLVDEVRFYLAPTIGGGPNRSVEGNGFACKLSNLLVEPVGADLRVTATPIYSNKGKR